jgi:hypothetical protein
MRTAHLGSPNRPTIGELRAPAAAPWPATSSRHLWILDVGGRQVWSFQEIKSLYIGPQDLISGLSALMSLNLRLIIVFLSRQSGEHADTNTKLQCHPKKYELTLVLAKTNR